MEARSHSSASKATGRDWVKKRKRELVNWREVRNVRKLNGKGNTFPPESGSISEHLLDEPDYNPMNAALLILKHFIIIFRRKQVAKIMKKYGEVEGEGKWEREMAGGGGGGR